MVVKVVVELIAKLSEEALITCRWWPGTRADTLLAGARHETQRSNPACDMATSSRGGPTTSILTIRREPARMPRSRASGLLKMRSQRSEIAADDQHSNLGLA
jgi:hypothetical protein